MDLGARMPEYRELEQNYGGYGHELELAWLPSQPTSRYIILLRDPLAQVRTPCSYALLSEHCV